MPSEKVESFLSFSCDIADMSSPGKVRSEFQTKVGMTADLLELDAVDSVLCW